MDWSRLMHRVRGQAFRILVPSSPRPAILLLPATTRPTVPLAYFQ